MKNIKKMTAALQLKMQEYTDNQAQSERAQAAIDAAVPGVETMEKLRKQRSDEVGQAFIEKRLPDLASLDKAIAGIEQESATIRAAGEAAQSALHLLAMRHITLEHELLPLQQAQDDAINAFADAKDREAQAMLNTALSDINTAFEHMAAAYMIDRRPIPRGRLNQTNWQYRLEKLVSTKFNIHMSSDTALNELKAALGAIGVTDPGIKRFEKLEKVGPSLATPDPVVTITFSDPVEADRQHMIRRVSAR